VVRRVLVLVFILVGLVLTASSAAADHARFTDPDDSFGRLDIAWIRQTHERSAQLSYRIATYRRWRTAQFNGAITPFRIIFDTDHDGNVDRTLGLDVSRDGSWFAEMTGSNGRVKGYGRAWKPDRRTIQVVFPESLLGKNVDLYRWIAQTSYHRTKSRHCGDTSDLQRYCSDTAPNRRGKVTRWYRHDLRKG
jgi:hypothetical protein